MEVEPRRLSIDDPSDRQRLFALAEKVLWQKRSLSFEEAVLTNWRDRDTAVLHVRRLYPALRAAGVTIRSKKLYQAGVLGFYQPRTAPIPNSVWALVVKLGKTGDIYGSDDKSFNDYGNDSLVRTVGFVSAPVEREALALGRSMFGEAGNLSNLLTERVSLGGWETATRLNQALAKRVSNVLTEQESKLEVMTRVVKSLRDKLFFLTEASDAPVTAD